LRLRGRCAGNAERANSFEVDNRLLSKRESCDRGGRLNRCLHRGLRDRGVPDVADLAMLLVAGVAMPVRDHMSTQRAHRKDERDG
jgi:hypothetical protein